MRISVLLLVLASIPLPGHAQSPLAADGFGCLVDLEVPQFAVALSVPSGGHVEARVRLKADGQPAAIGIESSNPLLSDEVEYHLRKKATYRQDCGGKEITLDFTFKVEGPAVQCPFARVQFLPPNRFVITRQPVLSTPDIIPVNPPKKK